MKRKDYDKIVEKIANLHKTIRNTHMWDAEEVFDIMHKLRGVEDDVIDKDTRVSSKRKK